MRYLGKEVVRDMVVRDSVEEEDTLPAQEVPVDSCSCPSSISPCLVAVARYRRVSMVQVSHRDEPMNSATLLFQLLDDYHRWDRKN